MLAELSDGLVLSAMAAYAVAMVALAASVAFGPRRVVGRVGGAASASSTASAAGGSTATLERPVAADDAGAGRGTAVARAGRAAGIAVSVTTLAVLLHAASVVARGLATGRAPFGNMYEFTVATALAAAAAYLLIARRYDLRLLGVVVVPVVLLALGLSVTVLRTEAGDLLPVLDSYWLVIHVSAAIVASGAFTAGAALSVLYLARARLDRRVESGAVPEGRLAGWLSLQPSAARLDRLAYRTHAFVFPLWTFAVVAGAIWAESAWGRYWGWDPKETWAFVTWVVYAAYLHARATAGWRGRGAALLALAGFACFLFNLFGVNIWLTGLHSYAGLD